MEENEMQRKYILFTFLIIQLLFCLHARHRRLLQSSQRKDKQLFHPLKQPHQ
jgi:hypothetical protein